MPVHVVTDSTCDLGPALANGLGVTVVPLTVFFGEEALLDGVQLDAAGFYARLQNGGQLPRTSQPSAERFKDVYKRLGADGSEVVSIHLSSKLSGTLNAASVAREAVKDSVHVDLIDSYQVSVGLGLVVMEAAAAAKAGLPLPEVVAAARRAMDRITTRVMVDTLEYLQKGGRIGRARSIAGSLLSIKPILQVEDGEVAPFERVRTRTKATARLFELATARPRSKTMVVASAGDPAAAEEFAARLRPQLPHTQVLVADLGPVVGVYSGPGALGFAALERE